MPQRTTAGYIKIIALFILTRNLTACKQKIKYHYLKHGPRGMF